ncbi:MAG: hydrogenase maturation nickel metallochaperone HypA [Planctomycetota bacterium]
MHEFALAQSILRITLETAEAHRAVRVRTVRCRIGAMRQVVPSVLQTAFQACCLKTMAEGADLVIEVDPVAVTCGACGAVRNVNSVPYQCPACNSFEISVEGGTAAEVMSTTIDQENSDGDSGPAECAGAQRCHGG